MKVIYKSEEEVAKSLFKVIEDAKGLIKENSNDCVLVGFSEKGNVMMTVSTKTDKLGGFSLPIVFDTYNNDDSDIEWTYDEILTEVCVMVELGEINLSKSTS